MCSTEYLLLNWKDSRKKSMSEPCFRKAVVCRVTLSKQGSTANIFLGNNFTQTISQKHL